MIMVVFCTVVLCARRRKSKQSGSALEREKCRLLIDKAMHAAWTEKYKAVVAGFINGDHGKRDS